MKNFGIIDRWIYEDNRWDGPIEGAAVIGNKKYYLIMEDEDKVRNRVFYVYDLPDWKWFLLDKQHQLFHMYVGEYATYNEWGKKLSGKRKPTWELFFNYLKIDIKIDEKYKVGSVFEFV